jgi:hypothetical protein
MSSPWHARTGSTRDPEIAARRHHQVGEPPPPVNAYYCGVSVKQLSKTGSGQRVAQPCQRAESEAQVQLEVVCTAEACRGETRWKRHKGLLGEGGGRTTMMMYVRVACRLWVSVIGHVGEVKKASSRQVTHCTRAGLEVSERVVVHVAASWEVGSAALLFVIFPHREVEEGLFGWLRRDHGIRFYSRLYRFTHISHVLISCYLNTSTPTALQTQAKGSVS